MLYHASSITGLKLLKPHISTHGQAYVYAVDNPITALIFGVKKDDFDFIVKEEKDIPVIYECYPNAFQNIYKGKTCSLYEIENEGFLSGMTSWKPEYVCESDVKVVREIKINDLYLCLQDYALQGKLVIHTYEQTAEYRSMVSKHVVDRLLRFNIDLHNCLQWKDARFRTHYGSLISALNEIMDGKYVV